MGNFVTKEGTLVANVAQTFNIGQLGTGSDSNAQSFAYANDDATHTHTISYNGQSMTVKPGETRTVSGLPLDPTMTIGGDAGSVGAYRLVASTASVPPTFALPQAGPIVTAALADGAVTEVKLEAYTATDTLLAKRCAVAVFDATADATLRAQGVHSFGPTLPDNCIITSAWIEPLTTPHSAGDLAKIALGSPDGATGILAATLVSDAKFVPGSPTATAVTGVATFPTKFTAAQKLIATVSVEDLTGGKFALHIEYDIGA